VLRGVSRRSLPLGMALVALAAGLTACDSGGSSAIVASPTASASAVSPAAVAPAEVTITPDDDSAKVRLDKRVTVGVSAGTLSAVSVTSKKGKALAGELSADKLSWKSSGALAAGTTYTVSVTAAARNGRTARTKSSFRTLTPQDTASAWFPLSDGTTVGVGMPVIVNFTEPVSEKKRDTVEAALSVSTSRAVDGAWRWFGGQQVQWRPQQYWPAHTSVKVKADLAGVELSSGVWGKKNYTSRFKIGDAVISTVNVDAHTLVMRKNGKKVRRIPVTTGKASMATRNGIKVIMSRETSHRMRSESIGIEKDDPDYYDIVARYAMRLTNSGEFLHAAPWSTGSQGRANVSHGCTGMSTADARWLFERSKVGDVVVYKGSSRKLEDGNGYTAWNRSWSDWKA
jgi:lipoprotein-anchoring transpeptidase ErfK/SrfK